MMREQENSDGTGRTRSTILIALLCVLPLLYVFSIGPAAWLVEKHPSLDAPLTPVYAPLRWLVANTALEGAITWYLRLRVDI